MRGRRDDAEESAFNALERALAHYRRGEVDIRGAAHEAGLPEWEFLEEAQALPDPIAPAHGRGTDLPVFIRDRK